MSLSDKSFSPDSQAPAWEFSPESSSFLSCEAGASLSGLPNWTWKPRQHEAMVILNGRSEA